MSNIIRAFSDVKLQWLSLLTQDKTISQTAKVVAVYIITTHHNNNLGKAWPSFDTIARAIAATRKTVHRAVKELDGAWFTITKGFGHKSTEYEPSAISIKRANALRDSRDGALQSVHSAPKAASEEQGGGVKNVTSEGSKTGAGGVKNVTSEGSKMSPLRGQKCHLNQDNEVIKKPNARAHAHESAEQQPQTEPEPQSKPVFIKDGSFAMTRWSKAFDYLHMSGKRPEDIFPKSQQNGARGFLVPSEFPEVMPYSVADREKVNRLQETVSRFISQIKREEATAKKEAEKVKKEERAKEQAQDRIEIEYQECSEIDWNDDGWRNNFYSNNNLLPNEIAL